MQNKKRTKLISVLIILLCLSLCVGATYAYFTDSVKSDGNIIKSGKLDVTMEWANGTADPDGENTVWTDASKGAIFNYDLWEPGYTEVRHIRIKNIGNLAFKYKLVIVANGEVSELANVIDVYYFDPAVQVANRTDLTDNDKLGTLTAVLAVMDQTATGNLKARESVTITIALKMQENADNKYQDLSIGSDFSIQLYATQYTYESDAFDDQYDVGATFPSNENNTPAPSEPDEPDSIFTWAENGDGTYTVTGLKEEVATIENLVIPSEYKGLPVTAIGDGAFLHQPIIKSVTIPEGVTSIGESAFFACDRITSITLPNSITYVGGSAFEGCESLQYNEFDNAYYLGNNSNPHVVLVKATSTSITSCDIHENTNIIYHSAFFKCAKLAGALTIPNGVTQIGNQAFRNCKKITGELIIPDSVISIGSRAFQSCTGLTCIIIPDSVTDIYGMAFYSCTSLASINFSGTTEEWDAISFGDDWNDEIPANEVVCSNGTVALN